MSKFKRSSSSSFGNWMPVQIKFRESVVGCLPILEDGTVETSKEKVIVISKKNMPENLFEGLHIIQLSEDKKTIKAFRPYSGQHPAKFTGFSHKEGQDPAPLSQSGEFGDYQIFWSIFEIVGGKYKGCSVPYKLIYKFEPDEKGMTKFKGVSGERLADLETFLDLVVGDFDPPKWPDSGNILPGLQKLAVRAGKVVGLVFRKGKITTLAELDNPSWKQTPDTE